MTSSSTGTRWNGLRRSEFKRKPLPLARQVAWQARTPLRKHSKNPAAIAATREYAKWARKHRKAIGHCELNSKVCEKRPDGIHHVIKLSQGGARKPGPLAEAQGQVFKVSCNPCNWYVEQDRQWAKEHGFVKSNPLRRPGLMETKE